MDKIISRIGILFLVIALIGRSSGISPCGNVALGGNQQITLTSPGYPQYSYAPNSKCMNTITAPQGYTVNAKCLMNVYQSNGQCTTERFYLSRTYVSSLDQAPSTCGYGTLGPTKSVFNQMVIGHSSSSSNVGYWTCDVNAVCDCGWYASQKIVGGTDATINQYPSYAAVMNRNTQSIECGGAIISSWWVITAGHCMLGDMANTANVLVWVGGQNVDNANYAGPSQLLGVSQIKVHPSYVTTSTANDLALLRTSTEIQFTRGIGPVCLPTSYDVNAFDNSYVDMAGFGTTSFSGPKSKTLRRVTVQTMANSACKPKGYPNLVDGQICTFYTNRDACQYDSGGPVYYMGQNQQILIGIIISGKGCASSYPSLNTRVGYYLPWIRSTTGAYFCANT